MVYRVRSGIAAGAKRKGGFGFLPRAVSDEEKLYQRLNLRGKTVYDVGSYEGVFSLFAAQAVGEAGTLVVCEPNPECYKRTSSNLALNDFECRMILLNVALGNENEVVEMVCPEREPALSTIRPEIAAIIQRAIRSIPVKMRTLDSLITAEKFPVPQFVKIDTEGAEFQVLCGARETLAAHQPELFIEMHGTTPQVWENNRKNVQGLLESYGYSVYSVYGKKLTVNDPAGKLHCVAG